MTAIVQGRQSLEAYQRAADEFLLLRPRDDLAESVPTNTQKRITQDSLTVLRRRRPGFTVFGEMMIVFEADGQLRHVTPDNSVAMVADDDPRRRSWNWGHETGQFLMVLDEFADAKDFEAKRRVYEQVLKVPYCVTFQPDSHELQVYRHDGSKYVPVMPDPHRRFEIPELDVKLGVFAGWLRFWHQDRLVPIAEEQDEQLEEKDMLIYEQTSTIEDLKALASQQAATLEQQRRELAGIHERLRQRIERRARAIDRHDILHQLDGSVPIEQLELWLDELL